MAEHMRDLILRLKALGWSDERISFTTRLPRHEIAVVRESR